METPNNRGPGVGDISNPDEEKAPTYNQWTQEEIEEHGPCEFWDLATFKPDHQARRYSLDSLKIRFCVRWEGHTYPFATKLYDLNTTRKAFCNAWGPSYHDDDNCYEIQLVGLNPRTRGFQRIVARRALTIGMEECPVREWKIDSSQFGGKLPDSLEDHVENRKELDGKFADPESPEQNDGEWEADEDRDARFDGRGGGGGGRGRDDDFGPRGGFQGQGGGFPGAAPGGFPGAAPGFPGAAPGGFPGRFPGVAGAAAPPPPTIVNSHVWTGSPPGFNPPIPGEWRHCPTGQAVWTGTHYEPAPPPTPATQPAEEVPPIVGGLLRMADGSFVPAPHGVERLGPGNWIPRPDPRLAGAITSPSRMLPEPPPPPPERLDSDPTYYLMDNEWRHCPNGVRFDSATRQWVPRPAPPAPREEPKQSLMDTIASEKGIVLLGVLKELASGVFGGRREEAAAERERLREESRAATERARAEAEAAKEAARLSAEAQKEAARIAAESNAKATELAMARERESRQEDERRKEAERQREHERSLQREREAAEERRRAEDRVREDRREADRRFEALTAALTAKPAVDPALQELRSSMSDLRKSMNNGSNFETELKRVTQVAERLGFKREGDGPGGAEPDVIGPLTVTFAEKMLELGERFIKSRESAPVAAHAAFPNPLRPAFQPPPTPPRPGHVWAWTGTGFAEMPLPSLPAPAPVASLPAPIPTVGSEGNATDFAPYVQPSIPATPAASPAAPAAPPPAFDDDVRPVEITPPEV